MPRKNKRKFFGKNKSAKLNQNEAKETSQNEPERNLDQVESAGVEVSKDNRATITLKVITQFIGDVPSGVNEPVKFANASKINEIESDDNDNKSITDVAAALPLHTSDVVVGDVPKLDHNKQDAKPDEAAKHQRSFDDNYRVESPKQICIESNHTPSKRHAMLIQEISESSSSEEVKRFLDAEAAVLEMKIDKHAKDYRVDSPESFDENFNEIRTKSDVTVQEISESSSSESVKNEILASIEASQAPLKHETKLNLKIINIKELPSEENVKSMPSIKFECKTEKKLNKAEEAILEALYGNKSLLTIPNLPLDVISEEGSDCGSDVAKRVISDELDDDVFLPETLKSSKKPPLNYRRQTAEQPQLISAKIIEMESNIPEGCKSWETTQSDSESQAELVYLTSASSSATDLSERGGDVTDTDNEDETSEDTETNSLLENISVPSFVFDVPIEMKISHKSNVYLSEYFQENIAEQKLPDILEEDEERSLDISESQQLIQIVNKELHHLVSEHEMIQTREKKLERVIEEETVKEKRDVKDKWGKFDAEKDECQTKECESQKECSENLVGYSGSHVEDEMEKQAEYIENDVDTRKIEIQDKSQVEFHTAVHTTVHTQVQEIRSQAEDIESQLEEIKNQVGEIKSLLEEEKSQAEEENQRKYDQNQVRFEKSQVSLESNQEENQQKIEKSHLERNQSCIHEQFQIQSQIDDIPNQVDLKQSQVVNDKSLVTITQILVDANQNESFEDNRQADENKNQSEQNKSQIDENKSQAKENESRAEENESQAEENETQVTEIQNQVESENNKIKLQHEKNNKLRNEAKEKEEKITIVREAISDISSDKKKIGDNDKPRDDNSNRVTPTLPFKRKNSSDSSSSANSQCTIIRQSAENINPLSDLCMESLKKKGFTHDSKITIHKKLNSSSRNAPQIPIMNQLELHYDADDLEGRENGKDRIITILQVPPETNRATSSPSHAWRGLQSSQTPNLMVALSPLQQTYMNSQDSNTSADELLDMHKKFVERRAYHETSDTETVENSNNVNSREMSVFHGESANQMEDGYFGDRESSVENCFSNMSKAEIGSGESEDNCDDEKSAEIEYRMNTIRNCLLRDEFFRTAFNDCDNFPTENSLQTAAHVEVFEEKKFELENELKQLDNERRELEEELKNLQSLQHFKREEFMYNEQKLLGLESRHSGIKHANNDFNEFINSNEKLQQELYNEWQDKVLERYERKLSKTIKITPISETNHHDDQLERAASDILRALPLENEFMTKLKERQQRLSLPNETELNSSTESLQHQHEAIKKTDEKSKNIPAHLYEFLKFYEEEIVHVKNSDESGESKHVNPLLIGLIGVSLCLCGFYIGKFLITQRSKLF